MKTTTLELLDRAKPHYKSIRQLSVKLGLGPTTLSTANTRGRLSPTVAAALAKELKEDVIYWTAIAGLEAEKESKTRDEMLKEAATWVKNKKF